MKLIMSTSFSLYVEKTSRMVNTLNSYIHRSSLSRKIDKMKQKRISSAFIRIRNKSVPIMSMSANNSLVNKARHQWIPMKKELLREWDNLINPENFYSCCVSTTINVNVILEIKELLTSTQLSMFRETCLGHFLELDALLVQPQVLHALLLREVKQYNEQQMWFNISGSRLKFGIDEFALITGLRCVGDIQKFSISTESIRLKAKYFSGLDKVTKLSICECFKNKRWDCDDDAVKIAFLYFLHQFLLSSPPNQSIPDKHFHIVDSSLCNMYPWGKESFECTFNSMKEKYTGKSHRGGYIHQGFPTKCSLLGCPIVLQVWFFECCGAIDGKFAKHIDSKIPRILNWCSNGKPHMKELQRDILSLPSHLLKLKNIIPTNMEKEKLDLAGLFDKEKCVGLGVGHEIHVDDDDFQSIHMANESDNSDANQEDEVSQSNEGEQNDEFFLLKGCISNMAIEVKDLRVEIGSLKDYIDQHMVKVYHLLQCMKESNVRIEKNKVVYVLKDDMEAVTPNLDANDDVIGNLPKDKIIEARDKGFAYFMEKGETSKDSAKSTLPKCFHEESPDNILENMDPNELDELEGSAYKSLGLKKKDVVHSSTPLDDIPSFDIGLTPFEGNCESLPLFDKTPQDGPNFVSTTASDKTLMKSKAVKGLCPFYPLDEFDFNDPRIVYFDQWLLEGVNKLRRGKIYVRSHDMVGICLDFSVELVREKIWLYDLRTPGRCIQNSHVNVLFYYLRKKVKYGNNCQVRCTTTNNLFDEQLQSLYVKYKSSGCDLFVLKNDQDIVPNILGYFMDCSTPWVNVDHVLFPIYLGKRRNQWMLARLTFSDRKIYLYNSFKTALMSREARSTLSAYCHLLPFLVQISGFYARRTDIDLHSEPYLGMSYLDPYTVVEIQNPALQVDNDIGIFMTIFAEYFIENKQIPSDFDVDKFRQRFAFLLHRHGLWKAEKCIESDIEICPEE